MAEDNNNNLLQVSTNNNALGTQQSSTQQQPTPAENDETFQQPFLKAVYQIYQQIEGLGDENGAYGPCRIKLIAKSNTPPELGYVNFYVGKAFGEAAKATIKQPSALAVSFEVVFDHRAANRRIMLDFIVNRHELLTITYANLKERISAERFL